MGVPCARGAAGSAGGTVSAGSSNNLGDGRNLNIYIYISPNYFGGWVEPSKTPWPPLAFCEGSRAVWRFAAGKTNTIEKLTSKVSNLTCFTVHFATPAGGQPDPHESDVNNGAGDTGPALPLAN